MHAILIIGIETVHQTLREILVKQVVLHAHTYAAKSCKI